MKNILLMSVALLIAGAALNTASAEENKASNGENKVKLVLTEVVDGDTIKAVIGCKDYETIRLADIDCPEASKKSSKLGQQETEWNMSEEKIIAEGKVAKEKLESLLTLYKYDLQYVDTPEKICKSGNGDRFVGVIYARDINVNEFMVKEAGCRPFVCPENRTK